MMIMITNNTYNALENLLLDNVKLVKIKDLAPNYADSVSATFSIDSFDDTIIMTLTRAEYDDDLDLPVNKSKSFKLDPEKEYEFMDVSENPILDTINFMLEQLQDKLNEEYGIAPIGTTKLKNSNALEF